jgi:hypothetical protein
LATSNVNSRYGNGSDGVSRPGLLQERSPRGTSIPAAMILAEEAQKVVPSKVPLLTAVIFPIVLQDIIACGH